MIMSGGGEDKIAINRSTVGNLLDVSSGQGKDKIDIDQLSNDTFAFLGNSAFTSSGAAEVRVTTNSNGDSIVRVDVDGDGTTDTSYLVRGVDNLDAGDFIL